jgi:hypothetical protein
MKAALTPIELKSLQDWDELKIKQFNEAWQWMLANPKGRWIAWWLLAECRFFSEEFFGNSRDFLFKGKREIGAKIHSLVTSACGYKVLDKMQAEDQKRKALDQQVRAKFIDGED